MEIPKSLEKDWRKIRLEAELCIQPYLSTRTTCNPFILDLFLAGILFIISVIEHHHLSLILCLQSPAFITQPRPLSATPGCHYPSPAVPLIFVNTCPTVFPYKLPAVSVPPPAVLDYTLPSSYTPCSPSHNPGHPPISPAVCLNSRCHMCLTILRKA